MTECLETMFWPKRFTVVFLGFLGLLCLFGSRSMFSVVMVYIISDNKPNTVSLFQQCTLNGTERDLKLDISVAVSQYFNTAYFLGYVLTQLPGGYLASRVPPKRVFGSCIFISSMLTCLLASILQYNESVVFVIRFIQGIAEGPALSSINGVISAWAPKSEKTRMITFAYAGIYLSPAIAMFVSGAMTCYLSWNSSMYFYGGCGVIWTCIWFFVVYDNPLSHPTMTLVETQLYESEGSKIQVSSSKVAKAIPWKRIFCSLPVYAILIGSFARSYVFAIIVTQVPQYFADSFGMNISTIGFLGAFPQILMTVVVISGGTLFDKLIKENIVSVTNGRKIAQAVGFGTEATCLLLLGFVRHFPVAMSLLCVGEAISGLAISGFKVNPLDLAPQYASVLTGLTRLGTFSSSISTAVAGTLRQRNVESWQRIFLIGGSLHLFGVIIYVIFASGELQPWARDGLFNLEETISVDKQSSYGTTEKNEVNMNKNSNTDIVKPEEKDSANGDSIDIEKNGDKTYLLNAR